MSLEQHITSPVAMKSFVEGGRAYFTLRNNVTQGRVTYCVIRQEDGSFLVRTFTGSDNQVASHYSYMGTICAQGTFKYVSADARIDDLVNAATEKNDRWWMGFAKSLRDTLAAGRTLTPNQNDAFQRGLKKFKVKDVAVVPSSDVRVRGFEWFWTRLSTNKPFPDVFEFWHEGRCAHCGRRLTVPESIATGWGPDCAEMLHIPMVTLTPSVSV